MRTLQPHSCGEQRLGWQPTSHTPLLQETAKRHLPAPLPLLGWNPLQSDAE